MIDLHMPDADYRALPGLSQSGAKTLLTATPAAYAYEREHGRPDKPEFDWGHAVHADLLGIGAETVVCPPDPKTGKTVAAWNTNHAKDFAAQARARGQTPLLQKEADAVKRAADAVRLHPTAGPLLERAGHSEVSVTWEDPRTGVARKMRADRLTELGDRVTIVDVKSTTDASPRAVERHIADRLYHVQDPFYREGLEAHGADDPAFLFAFVEKHPPHLVAVYELDARALQIGADLIREAVDLYAACLAADSWPGYAPGITIAGVPPWAPTTYGRTIP